MSEWSKEFDSSSNLVRGMGSNPIGSTFCARGGNKCSLSSNPIGSNFCARGGNTCSLVEPKLSDTRPSLSRQYTVYAGTCTPRSQKSTSVRLSVHGACLTDLRPYLSTDALPTPLSPPPHVVTASTLLARRPLRLCQRATYTDAGARAGPHLHPHLHPQAHRVWAHFLSLLGTFPIGYVS